MIKAISIISAILLYSTSSLAQSKTINHWGGQADVGLPDGVAVGPVYSPNPWIRLNFSGTYHPFAPGLRGGFTLDPMPTPVALTATAEMGHTFAGNSFLFPAQPSVRYNYLNLHLGLEFGKKNNWRLFFHTGPTWIWLHTTDLNRISNSKGFQTDEADISGRFFPSAKIGFVAFF